MIQLIQFPFSHYCEKVRWALDYKHVPFQTIDLLPGFHLRTVGRIAPETCVPVLRDGEGVLQDSTVIIDYLDKRFPNPSLSSSDPAHSREAREWEEYLDEEIGVTLRLFFYYHILSDRRRALSFLLRGAARYKQPLFKLAYPVIRRAMMAHMTINATSASQSEQRLRAAFDKLDETLDRRSFLVKDRFSRADLTACALLSPLCLPGDAQASALFPPAVLELRDMLKGRAFYRWVRNVYKSHRQPQPEDALSV